MTTPEKNKSAEQESNPEQSSPEVHPPEVHWSDEVGKNAPNVLTFLRMCAVPFFVVFLIDPTPQSRLWATLIFVMASLTDWLDGYIARIYKAESILGKLLDPLADKVLVMGALVMLSAIAEEPRVPAWVVVVLLSREFIVTGLRSLAAVQGTVVAASYWAKHKTAWMLVAIVFLLIHHSYDVLGLTIDFHKVGMLFLWLSLFLSVSTGVHYAVSLRKMFV